MTSIRAICSMATRPLMLELAAAYRETGGPPVGMEAAGGVDVAKRVQAGEPFDVVALASNAIDTLMGSGHLLPGTRVDVARSGVAIAVRAGAPRPPVDSEDAVRRAVSEARTIGFSTGPSGVHLTNLFARWGIADAIADRIVRAPPGVPVGQLIVEGSVELGFQQLSELLFLPGLDVLGPLPPAIQLVTTFSAAVCATTTRSGAARRFLAFLAAPEAADAKHRHGMAPA